MAIDPTQHNLRLIQVTARVEAIKRETTKRLAELDVLLNELGHLRLPDDEKSVLALKALPE